METKDNKTEGAAKTRKEINAIRARAARMEAALKRKEEELLRQERESQDYKDTFAPRDPSYRLSRLTPKSVEEIVASGTPKEVAYLNALTFRGLQDNYTLATREQYNSSFDRLSYEEQKEAQAYFNSLCALSNYEEKFLPLLLDFQKDAAFLARYATEWREYETLADTLTALYRHRGDSHLFATADALKLRDKVTIYFDGKSKTFKVNIGDENSAHSLRRKIQMRRAYMQESLRELKERVEAIYLFLQERDLPEEALPFALEAYIIDLKAEAFLHTLDLGEEYFRSHINARVANGEEPTAEDIERAVFADFYELTPMKENIEACKRQIASLKETNFYY